MVIVINNTGCYAQNLELVAQQMINIETNKNIYKLPSVSDINKKCKKCKTKKNSIIIEPHLDIDKNINNYSTKFDLTKNVVASDAINKFNVYKIKNEQNMKQGSYYNNEIEVETTLKIGQIIIYTSNYIDVKSYLESRCMEYSRNVNNKYPIDTYLNNELQSTNYILFNTFTNYLNRIITSSNEQDNKNIQKSINNTTFLWYYHIVSPEYSNMHQFLQSTTKSILRKENMNFGLSWVNNNIDQYQCYLSNIFNISAFHLLLSPSTIILDCANFLKPNIRKSLNYPKADKLMSTNFVPNLIAISERFGTIFHIYKNIEKHKKNIRAQYHKYNSIFTTYETIKGAKIVDRMTNIAYTFHYKSKLTYEENLEWDIKQMKKRLLKSSEINIDESKANITKEPNNPDVCYITGLPLFGTYLEVYFNIQIKIKTTNKTILTKMCISLYGLNTLHRTSNSLANNLMTTIFSKNKFNVVPSERGGYCISFVSSDISIYSAIDTIMIASDQEKELLKTIEKYGMNMISNNFIKYKKILAYNPDNNQIYFGVDVNNLTDAIIMYMQYNSDSILFSYTILN